MLEDNIKRWKRINNHFLYFIFINKWLYFSMLWIVSRVLGNSQRFSLIYRAIRDAENRKLGKVEDIS